jgi:hypothetical protein
MREETHADPITFIREIVRHVFWQIEYHSRGMVNARKNLKFAEEMIERGKFDADSCGEEDDDGVMSYENVDEFAGEILHDQKSSAEYHEKQLKNAYAELAFVKIMLQRGNYTEIDTDEIHKKVIANYDKPK